MSQRAGELGKLVADFTGHGATRARAFVHQDVAVCLLEDGGSRAETQLVATVERLTQRRVVSFLSGTSTPGTGSVEVFVLGAPAGSADPPGLSGGPVQVRTPGRSAG